MQISEAMTTEPFVLAASASLRQAVRVMSEADIRHVPIVEDETLVGLISDRDLRSLMPTFLDRLEQPEQAERMLSQPVSNVMSADVISLYPEDDLADAIDLLIDQQIGAIPIVEPGSKKLVGMLSYVDALRAARDVL